MSAQTNYSFKSSIGEPGGIIDLAPYAIDAFANDESTGVMKFGVGVIAGEVPGKTVKLPTGETKAEDIQGISVTGRTTEHGLEGGLYIRNKATIGVMSYGRVYARVAADTEVAYGDDVYVITDGDEAGYVTNSEDGAVKINARFLGGVDSGMNVAPVELYNSAN